MVLASFKQISINLYVHILKPVPTFWHKNVKMLSLEEAATSNFEVNQADIVITKATHRVFHAAG